MWHLFFDLDITLFCRRDKTCHPSVWQYDHVNTLVYGNILTGVVKDPDLDEPVCNPLYSLCHSNFFESIAKAADGHCQLYFLTAAEYDERVAKQLLTGFFSNTEQTQQTIERAIFFNAFDLRPLTNLDYSSANNEAIVEAKAAAKSRRMLVSASNFKADYKKVVLIDDNHLNRTAAAKAGFQVINPCGQNYPAYLKILQFAVQRDSHCSFPCDIDEIASYELDSITEMV